jgi:dTDP-glucose 4,6-dehydratase
MKTILVTGGAGFIGSHFIRYLRNKYEGLRIINADLLTYAGNPENLRGIEEDRRYTFVRADIRDKKAVRQLFERGPIDAVVNFAAQSHVDRSIAQPEAFLTTNVLGTQVLLEAAREHWKSERSGVCDEKFVQVSTDEVYGALDHSEPFSETMPLLPNNPYSASKASADLIVRAYHQTYGLPVCITRSCNNYGPCQFPEKLIPLVIVGCMNKQTLPVYGDGLQTRDWLHVADHCSAVDAVLQRGADGEIYNIGGGNRKTNIELVRMIVSILGGSEELIQNVPDRPGHDRNYAVDDRKIRKTLGWKPVYAFEQGIRETIEWYKSNPAWIDKVLSGYPSK